MCSHFGEQEPLGGQEGGGGGGAERKVDGRGSRMVGTARKGGGRPRCQGRGPWGRHVSRCRAGAQARWQGLPALPLRGGRPPASRPSPRWRWGEWVAMLLYVHSCM